MELPLLFRHQKGIYPHRKILGRSLFCSLVAKVFCWARLWQSVVETQFEGNLTVMMALALLLIDRIVHSALPIVFLVQGNLTRRPSRRYPLLNTPRILLIENAIVSVALQSRSSSTLKQWEHPLYGHTILAIPDGPY